MSKSLKIISLSLATILIVGSLGYWQFSNPQIINAVCLPPGSLNRSTYNFNVNDTFNVIYTVPGCSGLEVDYFSSGSWIKIPSSSSDLSCNGGTCSGSPPLTVTLKCIAAGTYSIRGTVSAQNTTTSTVTCSGGTVSPIPNEVQIQNSSLQIRNINMVIKQP
jgi:hypothetical protein